MASDLSFAIADESDLNEFLVGHPTLIGSPWPQNSNLLRMSTGKYGVLWRESADGQSSLVRPLAVVLRPEDQRHLFGRLAQVRTDLSPLSAWCHVPAPEQFDKMSSGFRLADLNGLEASWIGLIIAEASLLAERPLHKLKVATCFATQTYAIARSLALWGQEKIGELLARYDQCQALFGRCDKRAENTRVMLEPIWSALARCSIRKEYFNPKDPLANAILMLSKAKRRGHDDAHAMGEALQPFVPESRELFKIEMLSPEHRVRLFDDILKLVPEGRQKNSLERSAYLTLAAYIATIAAGGAPSLTIAEERQHEYPELLALTYVLGSIGERVTWTAGFDGLGRLVGRDLLRPFRLDDPPSCDFILDEALILVDPQVKDPLVHLRIKQARIATVGMLPGVNVMVSFAEQSIDEVEKRKNLKSSFIEESQPKLMQAIADAIWPHIQEKIRSNLTSDTLRPKNRTRSNKRGGGSTQLY